METPIVSIAPWIYNRNRFYFRDHPVYHPRMAKYRSYWETHERRSVEGFWGLDQQSSDKNTYEKDKPGGYRWMTGAHYWYTNFCFISHEDESEDSSVVPIAIQPDLRDIDWYIFYIYEIAQGFSGFADDPTFTCNRLVKKYNDHNQSIDKFTPIEKKKWKRIQSRITKPDGSYKVYIDALDYLKSTFTRPLGLAIYDNFMRNVVELSSRGVGKSYRLVGMISQKFNFKGAKSWKKYLQPNPTSNVKGINKGQNICVGSALSSKSGELLEKFKFSQDLLADNFGAYQDDNLGIFYPGYFHKQTQGSLMVGNGNNTYRHRFKIKKGNTWLTKGSNTKIIHQSYENNPEAFVGLRSVFMVEDEFGLNDKATKTAKADETVMYMNSKIGISWKTGTGGNILKIQEPKAIFYNPEAYGYLGFENNWERGKKRIGVFIPAYYQNSDFRDPQGNQDIHEAYKQEMHERLIRSGPETSAALDGWITARPLVPSEMFLAPELDIFPGFALREHRADVENRDILHTVARIGTLAYVDEKEDKVKFIEEHKPTSLPITTFSLKPYNGNLAGRCIQYEGPVDNIPTPTFERSLYKVVYDPYANDGEGPSLGSILVYKGLAGGNWNQGIQNNFVFTYHGRPNKVHDMHDMAIKIAEYYNAKILVENNISDFIRYCKMKQKVHLLQITPYKAISKFLAAPSRKFEFGVNMTKTLSEQAEQLIRQNLLEERGVDEETNKKILNLHHIYDLKILDDLIHYDRKVNTDSTSAYKLLALWLYQEKIVPINEDAVKERAITAVQKFFQNELNQPDYYKIYDSII